MCKTSILDHKTVVARACYQCLLGRVVIEICGGSIRRGLTGRAHGIFGNMTRLFKTKRASAQISPLKLACLNPPWPLLCSVEMHLPFFTVADYLPLVKFPFLQAEFLQKGCGIAFPLFFILFFLFKTLIRRPYLSLQKLPHVLFLHRSFSVGNSGRSGGSLIFALLHGSHFEGGPRGQVGTPKRPPP